MAVPSFCCLLLTCFKVIPTGESKTAFGTVLANILISNLEKNGGGPEINCADDTIQRENNTVVGIIQIHVKMLEPQINTHRVKSDLA